MPPIQFKRQVRVRLARIGLFTSANDAPSWAFLIRAAFQHVMLRKFFKHLLFMAERKANFQEWYRKNVDLMFSKTAIHVGMSPSDILHGDIQSFLKQQAEVNWHRPVLNIVKHVQSHPIATIDVSVCMTDIASYIGKTLDELSLDVCRRIWLHKYAWYTKAAKTVLAIDYG